MWSVTQCWRSKAPATTKVGRCITQQYITVINADNGTSFCLPTQRWRVVIRGVTSSQIILNVADVICHREPSQCCRCRCVYCEGNWRRCWTRIACEVGHGGGKTMATFGQCWCCESPVAISVNNSRAQYCRTIQNSNGATWLSSSTQCWSGVIGCTACCKRHDCAACIAAQLKVTYCFWRNSINVDGNDC